MKGEFVVVRAYEDRPFVSRVWDTAGDIVLISSPEQFEQLTLGNEALMPIGFRRSDVFQYDPAVEELIKTGGRVDWKRLRPY